MDIYTCIEISSALYYAHAEKGIDIDDLTRGAVRAFCLECKDIKEQIATVTYLSWAVKLRCYGNGIRINRGIFRFIDDYLTACIYSIDLDKYSDTAETEDILNDYIIKHNDKYKEFAAAFCKALEKIYACMENVRGMLGGDICIEFLNTDNAVTI